MIEIIKKQYSYGILLCEIKKIRCDFRTSSLIINSHKFLSKLLKCWCRCCCCCYCRPSHIKCIFTQYTHQKKKTNNNNNNNLRFLFRLIFCLSLTQRTHYVQFYDPIFIQRSLFFFSSNTLVSPYQPVRKSVDDFLFDFNFVK